MITAYVALGSLQHNPYFDKRLRELADDVDYNDGARPSAEEMPGILSRYDIVIVGSRERVELPAKNVPVRASIVGTLSIGTDHISKAVKDAANIKVINSPNAGVLAVAEHTLAFLFALAKRLRIAQANVERGDYTAARAPLPIELSGRVLGIVGLGNIGSAVASRAEALGLRVLATTRNPEAHPGVSWPFVSLEELVPACDFLTVHVPLTKETRCLIDRSLLSTCKPGLILVNTSRPEVVENECLGDLIRSRKLHGAGLDYDEDNWDLARLPQVIFTPHTAGVTVESNDRIDNDLIDRIHAAFPR